MAKIVNIGLFGLGTVGGGVYEILKNKHDLLLSRYNIDFRIVKICVRDIEKKRDIAYEYSSLLTTDMWDILNDPSIDIVVELIGGIDKAFLIFEECMKKGKHVVTTGNKALLSARMQEIEELLQAHPTTHYGFEATVGGGTPILHSIQEYYNTDEVRIVRGIINGSTNYILSKMLLEHVSYEDVYQESMDLGYLEANPDFDIKGLDAQSKLMILNRLAFGVRSLPEKVFCEGIQNIRLEDIQQLKEMGYHVKLMGTSKLDSANRLNSGILISAVSLLNPLASVHYADNIIQLTSKDMRDVSIIGSGAGRYPTANSVVTDILHIATNQFTNSCVFSPVNSMEMADDFSGDFFIRVDECAKEWIQEKVAVQEERGAFWRVSSTLKTLTQIRELYLQETHHVEKNFLILYIVEFHV